MTRKPMQIISEKGNPATHQKHDCDSNGDFSNIIVQLLLVPFVLFGLKN